MKPSVLCDVTQTMPAMTSSHIESLYSLDGHSADIVSALNLQRQQVPSPNTADLCDVIVRCAGSVTATSNHDRQLHSHHHHQQPIRAHRCVLASGSEYFQTLFMSRVDGGRAALRLDSGRMAMVEVNLPFVSRDTASKVWSSITVLLYSCTLLTENHLPQAHTRANRASDKRRCFVSVRRQYEPASDTEFADYAYMQYLEQHPATVYIRYIQTIPLQVHKQAC